MSITAILAQGLALAAHLPPALQSAPQGAEEPAPLDATRAFRVHYHHAVTNKTATVLEGVVVYLPVPQSDSFQQIEGFRVERERPVHISNRTGAYGTKIKRVALPPLQPGERFEVGFSLVLRLGAPIHFDLAQPAAAEAAPPDMSAWLKDDAIFSLRDPLVAEPAAKLLKEHPDPTERALAIHDYVASRLRYQGGDGWDRAPEVLRRGSGSCSEFSYVFSALCRASGLPTRFAGASILPMGAKLPFEDRGWHRWVEVHLPGRGWVPFDPTLDRGRPAKRRFAGTHHRQVLVLTRIGTRTSQLGLSYIGADNATSKTRRARWFTWSALEEPASPAPASEPTQGSQEDRGGQHEPEDARAGARACAGA